MSCIIMYQENIHFVLKMSINSQPLILIIFFLINQHRPYEWNHFCQGQLAVRSYCYATTSSLF